MEKVKKKLYEGEEIDKMQCIRSIRTPVSLQTSDDDIFLDPRMALMFDIVTYLISRFISGTRIVDHSVPEVVKNKFAELMVNLGVLLSKFGEAVICKEHVSPSQRTHSV